MYNPIGTPFHKQINWTLDEVFIHQYIGYVTNYSNNKQEMVDTLNKMLVSRLITPCYADNRDGYRLSKQGKAYKRKLDKKYIKRMNKKIIKSKTKPKVH